MVQRSRLANSTPVTTSVDLPNFEGDQYSDPPSSADLPNFEGDQYPDPPSGTDPPSARRGSFSYGDLLWLTEIPALEGFIATWEKKLADLEGGFVEPDAGRYGTFVDDFIRDLHKQDWWTSHTDQWRAAEKLKHTDRATYDQTLMVNRQDADIIARQLGFRLTGEQLDRLANEMLVKDWQAGQLADIERSILNTVYFDAEEPAPVYAGTVKTTHDSLEAYASEWLVSMNDKRLWEFAFDVKKEGKTWEQATQLIADTAKVQYDWLDPSLIDRLYTSGMTISDHLEPVKQTVAKIWEMDSEELSLSDDWFQDSLVVGDDKTTRFVNSREARMLAYKDPRYKKTDDFRGKMNNFTSAMSEFFGVRSWR